MQVEQDIPLAPLTTFRMGPRARFLITITSAQELPEAFVFIKEQGLPYFILGGGSNTIFTDTDAYAGVILKMAIPGFGVLEEDDSGARIRVGAGENWDSVVERTVEMGFSGMEAMSAIPGSAGAAPVQNIGAYGQELDRIIESVEAYDRESDQIVTLPKDACRFTYRDSIFKHTDRYVVTAITLSLLKGPPSIPNYADPIAYFSSRSIERPTLRQIREAIIEIRQKKLPDPRDVASVGSFFKNPIVDASFVERAEREWPRTVIFPMGEGRYKAGAGWMLEMLGYKGRSFGKVSTYESHALVLVNNGGATFEDLNRAVTLLQDDVQKRFGVTLDPEPVFV